MYRHKVIGTSKSKSYVDVPVKYPTSEITHDKIVKVVACVCCGLDETKILKYKITDVKKELRR